MLERIEIHQLALISEAVLDFGEGFQVLSGETGAGKSLLLGAISALKGEALKKEIIRHGCDYARIEGYFSIPEGFLADDQTLSELLDCEDEGSLILSREVRTNGRTFCRVNGRLVPLGILRRLGDRLIAVHGQNDRQQIFDSSAHLDMLDRYAGEAIGSLLAAYERAYQAWLELLRQEREFLADPEERRMLGERLDYQINEIVQLHLLPGEDEKLQAERELLLNHEKLTQALARSLSCLQADEAAVDKVAIALGELRKVAHLHPVLCEAAAELESVEAILETVTVSLRGLSDEAYGGSARLEAVTQRLDQISKLKRKYGNTIEDILAFLEKAEQRRNRLVASTELASKLQERKRQVLAVLEERALALRAARRLAGERLGFEIERELAELGMKRARFEVAFTERELAKAGSKGLDKIEFMLQANPGEGFKALAQTASGGEASRIMLAIKAILSEADDIPILIFDEVDTGISGETTTIVARKLKRLASSHQILCVTHQAQVAAQADGQFLIFKDSNEDSTNTYVKKLNAQERAAEIARLLNGRPDDKDSLNLASTLLAEACQTSGI